MKRLFLSFVLLLFLLIPRARAEESLPAVNPSDLPDVSVWQTALDESDLSLNVSDILRTLIQGDPQTALQPLLTLAQRTWNEEFPRIGSLILRLTAPALLWAIARQLTAQNRLSGAAGLVCYLIGALIMLEVFYRELSFAQETISRISALTDRIFPVLTALMSASGRAQTAGLIQTLISLCGGVLTEFIHRIISVLCASAAILAAAGNLSERMPLKGLFKLCCGAGSWLLGGVMALFAGMTALGGVLGSARDGMALRTAKYAGGSLLPIVGGDVAGTMDSMVYSAALVRQAAGVTGVLVMLGICLRPVIRLTLTMLAYMLSAALLETVADGALRRCMEQLGQCIRLLLAASLACAVLFIMLIGVCLGSMGG